MKLFISWTFYNTFEVQLFEFQSQSAIFNFRVSSLTSI